MRILNVVINLVLLSQTYSLRYDTNYLMKSGHVLSQYTQNGNRYINIEIRVHIKLVKIKTIYLKHL